MKINTQVRVSDLYGAKVSQMNHGIYFHEVI